MSLESYPRAGNKLRAFICHASGDKPDARIVYELLKMMGAEPWLDEKNLVVGIPWEEQIEWAVPASDVCILLLSKGSVTKEGYVQREIRMALRYADEKPEGTAFVLPLLLEACDVPQSLQKYHYARRFGQLQDVLESQAKHKSRVCLRRPRSNRFRELRTKLRQNPDESTSIVKPTRRRRLPVLAYNGILLLSFGWATWRTFNPIIIETSVASVAPQEEEKEAIGGSSTKLPEDGLQNYINGGTNGDAIKVEGDDHKSQFAFPDVDNFIVDEIIKSQQSITEQLRKLERRLTQR